MRTFSLLKSLLVAPAAKHRKSQRRENQQLLPNHLAYKQQDLRNRSRRRTAMETKDATLQSAVSSPRQISTEDGRKEQGIKHQEMSLAALPAEIRSLLYQYLFPSLHFPSAVTLY